MRDRVIKGGINFPYFGKGSLLNDLPPCKISRYRNELDRYGFSWVLAQRCGLRKPLRSFCSWVHGWIWYEPTADNLGFQGLGRAQRLVVRAENERLALAQEGFCNVIVGGLPFAYIPRQEEPRFPNSLLAIPPHSSEAETTFFKNYSSYVDYLLSLKNQFDQVAICIHYLDKGKEVDLYARAHGLDIIYGARPDDANSLIRTRAILERFEYVTSNNIGSHFAYALSAGCKFSFDNYFYDYKDAILQKKLDALEKPVNYLEAALEVHSEKYVRSKFPQFFKDSPKDGIADESLARSIICPMETLSSNELMQVLGWNVTGQIRGYLGGASRRISRLARSFSSAKTGRAKSVRDLYKD